MSESVSAGIDTISLASNGLPKLHSQWRWHITQQPNKLALIELQKLREHDNAWSSVAVCTAPHTRQAIKGTATYLLAMYDSWNLKDQELLADDLLGKHYGMTKG